MRISDWSSDVCSSDLDMGNAERWFARFGRDYLYTTAKGWLGWDGRRYRVLNQEKDVTPAEVMASVFETVRAIQRESAIIRDTGVDPLGHGIDDEDRKSTRLNSSH